MAIQQIIPAVRCISGSVGKIQNIMNEEIIEKFLDTIPEKPEARKMDGTFVTAVALIEILELLKTQNKLLSNIKPQQKSFFQKVKDIFG